LFQLKHSFKSKKGLNAVVLNGVLASDLLKIKGVKKVHRDNINTLQYYANSWGLDRIDPPMNNDYSPKFTGCGVDVYVVDTGIDTLHNEFVAVSGVSRTVTNIMNVDGSVSSNTDTNGHGTHCAG
jgi:subtilisin family serine protease